jgi:DNA polymerase-3 subunit epsilon
MTQKPSRQIVLDTETTGLSTADGNRIIEIGCVELVNRRLTGETFHQYINPERDSEAGALEVHGITTEFLADKPKFADVFDDFMRFIEGGFRYWFFRL